MKTLEWIIISQNYTAKGKLFLDDSRPVLLCCFLNYNYSWVNDWWGAKDSLVSLSIWLHGSVYLLFSDKNPSQLPLCIKTSHLGEWGELLSCFGRGQNDILNSCRKRPMSPVIFESSSPRRLLALGRLRMPPGNAGKERLRA